PIMFMVWALISGTGASRGDEERGLVEAWLAQGMQRWRYVVTRVVVFAIPAASVVLAPAALALVIARANHETLNPQGMALEAMPITAIASVCFAAGMLSGQLYSTRRNALGAGIVVLFSLYLLNGFSRTVDGLRPYRWISPFAYLDRSNPVVPGGRLDVGATVVIVLFAAALTGLTAWAFGQRDVGGSVFKRTTTGRVAREPARNPLTRNPVLSMLWEQRIGVPTWSIALFLYALSNLSLTRSFVAFFGSQRGGTIGAQARVAFGYGRGADPYVGFIGGEWFPVLCLMLAAFAITQVARWASEDTDGRLEMTLSAPVARWRVVAWRGLSLFLMGSILIAFASLAVAMSARIQGFNVDGGRLLLASVLVLPVALVFGAVGAATAAARPRMAMAVLAAILVVSYVIPLMAVPIFTPALPPDWFVNLSVFKLYGDPLVDGVNWNGLLTLLAVGLAGSLTALYSMQRREVGR
ncbi:MAG TPA: ABC transporter permease subunit, partial [Candidatus Dormibacteraeota bacterium]|nr:ABC transporter permease subunit [Candidatus Dormibacteraeota bacterium]